jgi:hypothetical protein
MDDLGGGFGMEGWLVGGEDGGWWYLVDIEVIGSLFIYILY